MNPFYFGSSGKALFGMYHPPQGPGRNRGVVLCNPFGEEAMRVHRAYRQLAIMLAKARFHVLRFDYYATGDSSGEAGQGRMQQWIEDIATATDELKDTAGVRKVSWVGIRLGATLAVLANQGRRDVDSLILWDPVIKGPPYLRELRDMHLEYMAAEFHDRDSAAMRADVEAAAAEGREEIIGVPFAAELRDEIAVLDLIETTSLAARKITLLTTQRDSAYQQFAEHLKSDIHMEGRNIAVDVQQFANGADWNSESAFADQSVSAALVPKELLQAVVDGLT